MKMMVIMMNKSVVLLFRCNITFRADCGIYSTAPHRTEPNTTSTLQLACHATHKLHFQGDCRHAAAAVHPLCSLTISVPDRLPHRLYTTAVRR